MSNRITSRPNPVCAIPAQSYHRCNAVVSSFPQTVRHTHTVTRAGLTRSRRSFRGGISLALQEGRPCTAPAPAPAPAQHQHSTSTAPAQHRRISTRVCKGFAEDFSFHCFTHAHIQTSTIFTFIHVCVIYKHQQPVCKYGCHGADALVDELVDVRNHILKCEAFADFELHDACMAGSHNRRVEGMV